MGVRQYPPPQKINIMLYYIISAEDMPNFVSSLIERWQITQQATPIESKQEQRDLMTVNEVCNLLHVVPATLNNWNRVGYLTKVKIGRRVLYHRQDVEAIANPHKSN